MIGHWSKEEWSHAIDKAGLHPFLIAFMGETGAHLAAEHDREFVYGDPRENARRHLVAHGVMSEERADA